jgi:hypothetical protein
MNADSGRKSPARIRLNPELDPASPAVEHGAERLTNVLDAPGSDRLRRDLRAYSEGRIAGRSYLISGHRGAGKTTLVIAAIQEVRAEREAARAKRPILVRLPAPKLLRVRPGPAGEASGSLGGASDTGAGPAVDATTEQVLRGITVGLFHALVEEYANAYTRGVRSRGGEERAAGRRVRRPPTGPGSAADLEELGAHLRVLVSQGPTLAELRDLWQRSELLADGVLGCHGPAPVGQAGIREVAVLWEALQVWQRVVGTRTLSNTQVDNKSNVTTQTATYNIDPKQVLNALVGLSVGAGVGFTWDSNVGAVVGAALSVLTFKTLDITDTATRTRSRDLQQVYTEHTGIGSVARLLPRLVATLRELGLAPVFVIDELDKIDNVAGRLADLLGDLKQLVAEEAFFCFLTDRSYYEHVHRTLAFEALPVEQTWFTERLYVHLTPGPIRHWLRHNLRIEGVDGVEADRDRAEVVNDLDVWVPVLLFRARLHVHSLRRELARLCDAEGVLRAPLGKVRSDPEYRFAVFYQLAVEHLLAEPTLARWLEDEPYNAQLATDALYYPARKHAAGEAAFAATEDALLAHFDARAGVLGAPGEAPEPPPVSGEGPPALVDAIVTNAAVVAASGTEGAGRGEDARGGASEVSSGTPAPGGSAGARRAQTVRRADLRLLVDSVRRLAELLADPGRLVSLFSTGASRRGVLTAAERGAIQLFAQEQAAGVVARDKAAGGWIWVVERFEPSLPSGQTDAIPDVDGVLALVDAVTQSLATVLPDVSLGDLAEQYDIVSTSPPYRELLRARKVLRDRGVPPEEKAQARGTIMAYGYTIREALPRLRMLIAGVTALQTFPGWHALPSVTLLHALRADPRGARAAVDELFSVLASEQPVSGELDAAGWRRWCNTEEPLAPPRASRTALDVAIGDALLATLSARGAGIPLTWALIQGIGDWPRVATLLWPTTQPSLTAWCEVVGEALQLTDPRLPSDPLARRQAGGGAHSPDRFVAVVAFLRIGQLDVARRLAADLGPVEVERLRPHFPLAANPVVHVVGIGLGTASNLWSASSPMGVGVWTVKGFNQLQSRVGALRGRLVVEFGSGDVVLQAADADALTVQPDLVVGGGPPGRYNQVPRLPTPPQSAEALVDALRLLKLL